MYLVVEVIVVIVMALYYNVEALVKLIIPQRRKNIKGQTVLITGAGSGLGKLMAHRFARLGCKMVLWDVNGESNEETASEIREFGVASYAYTCNLSSRDAIYRTADKVKNDIGDVDILVNNAGIVTGRLFMDCPDDLIEKTMAVNAMAHFWTVKSFLPAMLRRNRGHLVTIASGAGLIGVPRQTDYAASKFAAVGFEESLRNELHAMKKTGIKTTVVCPFYISTGMFEGVEARFPLLTPILEPEYVVDKIIEAVLTNQAILEIPKNIYLTVALKHIIPLKVGTMFGDFAGLNSGMDTFRGRSKQNW